MNWLAKLLGIDPKVYNQWQLNWFPEDPVVIFAVLGILIPLALWFSWASLNRVGSRSRKLLLFVLDEKYHRFSRCAVDYGYHG